MTKEFVHNVLKEQAASNRPENPDLWPTIQDGLRQTTPFQTRRSRAPFVLAGAFAAILIAAGLLALNLVTPAAPVSAAELFAGIEAASNSTASLKSFHGISRSEQRNSAYEGFSKVREEKWFVAPNKYRSDAQIKAATGEENQLLWVNNGSNGWKYDSFIGKSAPLSAKEMSLAFGAPHMGALFSNSTMVQSLYNVTVGGSEKVAGREAYKIELTLKPSQEWPQGMTPSANARITMWVDADAFFILRLESWDAEGKPLATEWYESFELNAPVDPSVFDVAAPDAK